MSDFTQRRGGQESPELPEEAKGEKEVEKDQGPEAEEPQLKQKTAQVRGAGWWGGVGSDACALPGDTVGHGAWLPAVSGKPELKSFFFH